MLNSNAPINGPPHFVDLHVNPGESVSIQLFDGNETVLRGPATITMISQHTFPPIPMPVQVPPGHMIQQIVDENGTLRHIILSALNNNGNTPPTNALMPPQQQQQPFPYCCCCCYSCTGGPPPAAPLPPPPPPPPQVHHNILAFPTQTARRRLPNRTYSPHTGKRASPAFYNNNTFKSPIRSKIGSTAAASIDGVSAVSYQNARLATPSDSKPYGLTSTNNLDSKIHSDNCIGDTNVCSKESHESIQNGIVESNSILKQSIANQSYYNDLDEDKAKLLTINEVTNYIDSDVSINSESNDKENANSYINDAIGQNDDHISYCNEEVAKDDVSDVSIENDDELNNEINGEDVDMSGHSNESRTESELNDPDAFERDQIPEAYHCKDNSSNINLSKSCISDNGVLEEEGNGNATEDTTHILESKSDQYHQKQLNEDVPLVDRENSLQSDNDHDKPVYGLKRDSERIEVTDTDECDHNDEPIRPEIPIPKQSPQKSPKHLLPILELLNLTYTSLTANTVKLKWTQQQPHSQPDQLYGKHYVVEMLLNKSSDCSNPNAASTRIVYQGYSSNCRISHLSSQLQYSFRVRTASDEHLIVSNTLTITTPEQPPVSNKYHKKNKQQLLQQQIQQQQHQIHQQQMLLQQQQNYQDRSQSQSCDEPTITTDQRCAILILLLFTMFALIVAVLIQHLLTNQMI